MKVLVERRQGLRKSVEVVDDSEGYKVGEHDLETFVILLETEIWEAFGFNSIKAVVVAEEEMRFYLGRPLERVRSGGNNFIERVGWLARVAGGRVGFGYDERVRRQMVVIKSGD